MTSFKGMKNAIENAFPGVYGIKKFANRNKLSFVHDSLSLVDIQKYFPQATQSEEFIFHLTWEV